MFFCTVSESRLQNKPTRSDSRLPPGKTEVLCTHAHTTQTLTLVCMYAHKTPLHTHKHHVLTQLALGEKSCPPSGKAPTRQTWAVSEAGPFPLPEHCAQEKPSCHRGAACPLCGPDVRLRRTSAGQSARCPPALNTGLLGPNSRGLGPRGLISKAGPPAPSQRSPAGNHQEGPTAPAKAPSSSGLSTHFLQDAACRLGRGD